MTALIVTLTDTSNEYLRPRLPLRGELEVLEAGTDGSIITATFRMAKPDGTLAAPVEVREPVFTYGPPAAATPTGQAGGDGRPTTAAVHYHLSEHHLACATRVHAEQTHPDYYPSMEKDFPTRDVRFERHMRLAELHTRLAEARTQGALLVQHHLRGTRSYVGAEAHAWNDELRGPLDGQAAGS